MDDTGRFEAAAREAIGALLRLRGKDLRARERRKLAAEFAAAGMEAIRPVPRDPYAAARSTVELKQRLEEARSRLAATSPRELPGAIVDPRWGPLESAMQANSAPLLDIPGVLGFGLGMRRRGEVEYDEQCVAVYVERKYPPEELAERGLPPVPTWLAGPDGGRVPVDVVEVGRLERYLLGGTSVGHAAVGRENEWATVGLIATDDFTGEPVVLTAMHLTGLTRDFPPGDELTFSCPDATKPGARRLGRLLKGSVRVDAAKIAIDDPTGVQRFIRGIGPIRGTRTLSHPGDRNTPVQLFGARSGYRQGVIDTPRASLPKLGLDEAILITVPCARGDSGAAVTDMQGRVLGLLIGELSSRPNVHAVSPIGAVFAALNCTF